MFWVCINGSKLLPNSTLNLVGDYEKRGSTSINGFRLSLFGSVSSLVRISLNVIDLIRRGMPRPYAKRIQRS